MPPEESLGSILSITQGKKPALQPVWAERQREGEAYAHTSIIAREAEETRATEQAGKGRSGHGEPAGHGQAGTHGRASSPHCSPGALPALQTRQKGSSKRALRAPWSPPSLHCSLSSPASCADVLQHKLLIRAQHEQGLAGARLQHFFPSRS